MNLGDRPRNRGDRPQVGNGWNGGDRPQNRGESWGQTPGKTPADEAALAVFNDFNLEIHKKMLKADKSGDETNYLYGKALENARRVALILAVGRDAGKSPICEADALYACTLVRYLVGDLIRAVKETVAETPDEKAKKRILLVVSSSGAGGISKKELTRKTQFIRKSFRDEYLDDLVESGELTTGLSESGGVIYRIGG